MMKRAITTIHLQAIRVNSHLSSTQDTEQPIKDQKEEQQQSSEPDKSTSNGDTAPSGDSPPSS